MSSVSSAPHYRFRSSSSGPLFSSASPGGDLHVLFDQEVSEQASLTTRCASSSEKTRPRPRGNRSCPPKTREPGEGADRRREHDFGSAQPLVLYGSNEFMVWWAERLQETYKCKKNSRCHKRSPWHLRPADCKVDLLDRSTDSENSRTGKDRFLTRHVHFHVYRTEPMRGGHATSIDCMPRCYHIVMITRTFDNVLNM